MNEAGEAFEDPVEVRLHDLNAVEAGVLPGGLLQLRDGREEQVADVQVLPLGEEGGEGLGGDGLGRNADVQEDLRPQPEDLLGGVEVDAVLHT